MELNSLRIAGWTAGLTGGGAISFCTKRGLRRFSLILQRYSRVKFNRTLIVCAIPMMMRRASRRERRTRTLPFRSTLLGRTPGRYILLAVLLELLSINYKVLVLISFKKSLTQTILTAPSALRIRSERSSMRPAKRFTLGM